MERPTDRHQSGEASRGRTLSRREVLRSLGMGTGALLLASLAACEPGAHDSASPAATASGSGEPAVDWDAWWADQQLTGEVDFANWPYYIDRTKGDRHPSLERFTAETGIDVAYTPAIQDNATFLEQIRPALEAGEPIGYDLVVISNGPELSEMIRSGWLTPLDRSRLPTFDRYAGPLVRDPIWDPGNRHSIAWQSGLTGIAYAPEAVEALGHEPTSIQDLWDPALRGKVGMMSDVVELGSAGLLAIGVDPSVSTPDNWRTAAGMLRRQQDAVEPRYYDQGYIDALTRRDTWITLAWSGDIVQLNNLGHPNVRFVVPDEGAMLWTDSMLIPRNAAHPLDALTLMDFVYRPRVAALIADWVWYLCPVPAAKPIVAQRLHDPEVAGSPLVFPGPDLVGHAVEGGDQQELLGSRVRNYYVYTDAGAYREWAETFEPIVFS